MDYQTIAKPSRKIPSVFLMFPPSITPKKPCESIHSQKSFIPSQQALPKPLSTPTACKDTKEEERPHPKPTSKSNPYLHNPMGLRTTWGLLSFVPLQSWQKEMTPVTSEGPVRTHTALRAAMAMGLGLGCGSDGQRSECERRNKRVWTPRRRAGSWLMYSCMHQRERECKRRTRERRRERRTTRASSLKSWLCVHYRGLTGWQTTVGT